MEEQKRWYYFKARIESREYAGSDRFNIPCWQYFKVWTYCVPIAETKLKMRFLIRLDEFYGNKIDSYDYMQDNPVEFIRIDENEYDAQDQMDRFTVGW